MAGGFFYWRKRLQDPATRLRWDGWLLRLPLVTDVIIKLETARFTRTLATLIGGGVPLLDSIYIAREVIANQAVATAIDAVAERVRQGEGLARPLQEADILPKLVSRLLQVGEETGRLVHRTIRGGERSARRHPLLSRR